MKICFIAFKIGFIITLFGILSGFYHFYKNENYDGYPREIMIEAISKEEAASRPLDGFIKFDGKVYRIINSGEVVPNIKTIINKLKKVPSQYRMIPNDTMNIEADSFERELYIDLNERK